MEVTREETFKKIKRIVFCVMTKEQVDVACAKRNIKDGLHRIENEIKLIDAMIDEWEEQYEEN